MVSIIIIYSDIGKFQTNAPEYRLAYTNTIMIVIRHFELFTVT